MSDIAIKLENISKQYRLGVVGTGTLSHDLNRWWAKMRGKEDPTLKIGQENSLAKAGGDYVWALKDINLEVKQGEVLGIIGKNGAGKSTLLKLLSQVTGPTTGSIKVNGRIASLLEVGTGFHPELTGKENIFLNGAILGMTKNDIKRKLDEIVEFAGVAKYLNTPVKRYSSGMYVRLAFAVAAHLEPDILVVDEVLAVGDAEFQKKAIGKMQDVSRGGGRTVLFVSHNMGTIKNLCKKAILLENGNITYQNNAIEVVKKYLSGETLNISAQKKWNFENAPGNEDIKILQVKATNINNEIKDTYTPDQDIFIKIQYEIINPISGMRINLNLQTSSGDIVFQTTSHELTKQKQEKGKSELVAVLPSNLLNRIKYVVNISIDKPGYYIILNNLPVVSVEIGGIGLHGSSFRENWPGIIAPKIHWQLNKQ